MTLTMLLLTPTHPGEAFLGFGGKKEKPLAQAKKNFENHEYYAARRFAQQALEENPRDP